MLRCFYSVLPVVQFIVIILSRIIIIILNRAAGYKGLPLMVKYIENNKIPMQLSALMSQKLEGKIGDITSLTSRQRNL